MPWKRALAALFLLVFAAQSFLASRAKSPVFDEPAHIAAGLSYVSTRVFHANPQHPPLLKELSGIGMRLGGVRWPSSAAADDVIAHESGKASRDWDVGNEILAGQGPDHVLASARWPMILVAALLGLAVYLWGRELLGETAALGALFLFAVDPIVLGHSYLVTTDVGVAAFSTVFLWALWRYARRPSLNGQIWCGVALGCALCAKYSAVLLLPIGGALLWASVVWPRVAKAEGKKRKGPAADQGVRPTFAVTAKAFGVMCLVALAVIEVVYLLRAGPVLYYEGLRRVNADHDPNYLAFLGGELKRGFAGYFAAAYLLKAPIAAILLSATGAVLLLGRRSMARIDKLFLFLPAAVLFVSYSAGASDIGIRYMIPALPFGYLAGGAALAWLVERHVAWARGAATVLCAWLVAAAAGIYPDHLSYFNESACVLEGRSPGLDGGSRCGPMWLDDSNVDWGQGLKQLKTWLDANGGGRPVHLLYFGEFPPQNYGIHSTDAPATPSPGDLYVISGHFLARLSVTQEQVRTATPLAVVGHALYVYQF